MQRSRVLERLRDKPNGIEPTRSRTRQGNADKNGRHALGIPRALVDLHQATDADAVFAALRRVLREQLHISFLAFSLRGREQDGETIVRVAGHPPRSELELGAVLERADDRRRRGRHKQVRLTEADWERAGSEQGRAGSRGRMPPGLLMGFDGCGYARASLLVGRNRNDDDFGADEVGVLSALQPHITAALRSVRMLQKERVTRLALQKLLSRFPVGIVLLDWEERVIYRNIAATELCALWNYGEAGRSLNASRVFRVPREVVRACRSLEARRADAPEISVLSPEEPRVRATVQFVHFEAQRLARPRYLIHFEAASGKRGVAPSRMDLLLRLTPRERELADLVGRGLSNADAARRLGKSVYTVKKQLQGVYRKLGVKSRAGLVVLLSR